MKNTNVKWHSTLIAKKSNEFILEDITYSVFVNSPTESVKPALAFGMTIEEAQENAKLIALAPEMFEIIKKLVWGLKNIDEAELTKAEKDILEKSETIVKIIYF